MNNRDSVTRAGFERHFRILKDYPLPVATALHIEEWLLLDKKQHISADSFIR